MKHFYLENYKELKSQIWRQKSQLSGEASLCKHLREQDTNQLSAKIKIRNKHRISKNSIYSEVRTCDQKIRSLTHLPLSHGSLKNTKH